MGRKTGPRTLLARNQNERNERDLNRALELLRAMKYDSPNKQNDTAQILEAIKTLGYNNQSEEKKTRRYSKIFFLIMCILVLVFSPFAAKQVLQIPKIDVLYGIDFASFYLYTILLCYVLSWFSRGTFSLYVHVICLFTVLNLVVTVLPTSTKCKDDEDCILNMSRKVPPLSEDWWLFVDPFKGERATFIGPNAEENLARVLWFNAVKKASTVTTKTGLNAIDQTEEGGWGTILSSGIFGTLGATLSYIFDLFLGPQNTKLFFQLTILTSAFLTSSTLIDLLPFMDDQFREFLVLLALLTCIYFLASNSILIAIVNILYLFFGLIPDQVYQIAVRRVVALESQQRGSLSEEKWASSVSQNTSDQNKLVSFSTADKNARRVFASFAYPILPNIADDVIAELIKTGDVRIVVPPSPKPITEALAQTNLFFNSEEFCAFIERMDGNRGDYDAIIQKRASKRFYQQILVQGGTDNVVQFIDKNYTTLFPNSNPASNFSYYLSPIGLCVKSKEISLFYDYSMFYQFRKLLACRNNPTAFVNDRLREIFEMDSMQSLVPKELVKKVVEEVETEEKKFFVYSKIALYRTQLEEFGFSVPKFPKEFDQDGPASAEYLKSMVLGNKLKLAKNAPRINYRTITTN
jgi:hypothetical protein